MKNILIAIDYDPSAEQIAEKGYELAQASNAAVALIHVISDAVYYTALEYSPVMGYTGFSSPNMVPMVDIVQLKAAAKDFLEQTKKHLNDESISTIVGEGDCADAILQTAKDIGADTIVIGSHSRRGFEKILMGSISEKVLNNTDIPLYMIPTKLNK